MTGMINTLMALPSRTLSTKGLIIYPDAATQALTAAEIIDWAVTENAGEHLPLGGASASTVRLRLDNRAGEWKSGGSILGAHMLDGAVIGVEIGAQHPEYSGSYDTIDGNLPATTYANTADGGSPGSSFSDVIDGGIPFNFPHVEWYWTRIGEYVVEKPKLTEMVVELAGSDYLANRALRAFSDTLTYPQTVLQIVTEACLQANITLKTTVFINSAVSIPVKPLWDENTTCRDVISYVACVAGGFARIDREGKLEIVPFDDTNDYSIGTDRYIDLERKTTFGSLNALTVFPHGTKENAVRVATDTDLEDTDQNSIAVQGNPLLRYESAALTPLINGIFSVLGGLAFESAKVIWQGDPTLAVGDVLTVTDKGGATCPILVLGQALTFASGFGMTSENSMRTATSGTARNMRIFTPSGRLNATALEGDINIKAGENVNILAGGDINIASGADLNIESGGKINIASADGIVLSSGAGIDSALGGKLGTNDPAKGVQTSKITIDSDSIDIASGGNITMDATNQLIFTGGSTLGDLLGNTGIKSSAGATAPASPSTGDLWFDTANFNVCKRWSGSAWVEYTQGKLSNSKMTLDATGIALLSGGAFTVASTNFMIDSSGNVSMKGAVTADTGYIGGTGGFTIQSAKLYSGKSTLTSTTAGVYVGTDGISLGSTGTPQFTVTSAGALTASNADITGKITATSGSFTGSVTATSGSFTGSVTSTSGAIGGFTIGSTSLSAQQSGKPLLKFDAANSEITLGGLKIYYDDISGYEFNVGTDELGVTASYFWVGVASAFFHVDDGHVWCNGDMSAASFTDRTPSYTGKNAVAELKLVRNDKNGNIDHSTLPAFARKKITSKDKKGKGSEADGRDIGAMISIITKAVQELDERIEKIENRTK